MFIQENVCFDKTPQETNFPSNMRTHFEKYLLQFENQKKMEKAEAEPDKIRLLELPCGFFYPILTLTHTQ